MMIIWKVFKYFICAKSRPRPQKNSLYIFLKILEKWYM